MIDPHSYDSRNSYHGRCDIPLPPEQSYNDPMRLVTLEREDPWDVLLREMVPDNMKKSRIGRELFDDHSLVKSLASIKNEDDLFIIKQILREDEEEFRRQRRANPGDPVHVINARIETTLVRVNKKLKRSRVGHKIFKNDKFISDEKKQNKSPNFRIPNNVRRSHWGSIVFKDCY